MSPPILLFTADRTVSLRELGFGENPNPKRHRIRAPITTGRYINKGSSMPPATIQGSCDQAPDAENANDAHRGSISRNIKRRAAIVDPGRIRLGGGCRLPLRGAPMVNDRKPRNTRNKSE